MNRMYRRLVILILAGLIGGASANNYQQTGLIEGTLNGEEHTWYTFRSSDPAVVPTANWFDIMGMFTSVSIQGHSELRYSLENAFTIELTLFDELEACPCTLTDAMITWWQTELYPHYHAENGTVNVEESELIGDGAYRLIGTYEATLVLQESMFADPDPNDTVEAAGRFIIDWLPEDPLD